MVDQANNSPTWTYTNKQQIYKQQLKETMKTCKQGQLIAQSIHEHKLYRCYGELIPKRKDKYK